jgi:predicted nuclease with RNAse H fold
MVAQQLRVAYAGIDVAIAKDKRLPVVVVVRCAGRLEPLALRARGIPEPPRGCGNAAIVEQGNRERLASAAVSYLRAVEEHFDVHIARIAIDAPSAPRRDDLKLREAEAALGKEGISYIQTPTRAAFDLMADRVRRHLGEGGSHSTLPCANQLWMLFGFTLFDALSHAGWECLEVYPQATVRMLRSGQRHKSAPGAVVAQMTAAASRTGWPAKHETSSLGCIAYGSMHDRFDAYLSAWVASVPENERRPIGNPPDDVIWVPRLTTAVLGSGSNQ